MNADAKVEAVLEDDGEHPLSVWLVDVMCQSLLDFSPLNFIRKLCNGGQR